MRRRPNSYKTKDDDEWSPHGDHTNRKPEPKLHDRNVTKNEKIMAIISFIVVVSMLLFWRYENRVIEGPIPKIRPEEKKNMNKFTAACAFRRPNVVMFMRIPKAASTAIVNGIRNLAAHTRRYRVHTLPEFRMGTGYISDDIGDDDAKIGCWGENRPTCSKKYYDHFDTASKLTLAKLAQRRERHVVEGHSFYIGDSNSIASIIATARDPIQRLASGYEYVYYRRSSAKKSSKQQTSFSSPYPPTIGACAANASCAAERDLGRLCSLHTLYFCGFNTDLCTLDPLTRIATDTALDQAMANINISAHKILLIIPIDQLESRGYDILQALLPTYFHGLADAVTSLPEDRKSYDPAGRRLSPGSHPHKSPDDTRIWDAGLDDPHQAAAIERLCKQDIRLFEFIRDRFNQQVEACHSPPSSSDV
mmetsp:Transcript_14336/g.19166  ORF Transcript_14336/g.19166 Transcript_14336/m.19166 type:complete len:420 (-) Transcript_14336:105-1364(-)